MKVSAKKADKAIVSKAKKKSEKKISRIKVQYDKELDALSGTILFPEKLAAANKFLKKSA